MTPPAPDPEAIVRRHQTGVWRYLRAIGAPADVAEDLLQETFLVAFDKLHDVGSDAAVAAFLRRTARHLWLRGRRDAGRREQLLLEHAERAWVADCAADGGDRWLDALRDCVQRLDGRSRQVVDAFYGERRARADVARLVGLEENGLKTLLQRLRAGLRRCVDQRLGEGGER
ncbi:MAG: hypothetical protein H6835_16640 [Planctomycetes bacterium]|nr:hypothetical protein [Planctomycetota bacterium]